MTHTIDISVLAANKACKRECTLLRGIFPNGVVSFDMAVYPKLRAAGINTLWASPLLQPATQIQIALGWYDRALATQSPAWKAPVRALVATPDHAAASAQFMLRQADRKNVPAGNEAAYVVAGIGYAATAFSMKFGTGGRDHGREQAGMAVLAQWCARGAALAEGKKYEDVYEEFKTNVFQALSQYGASL